MFSREVFLSMSEHYSFISTYIVNEYMTCFCLKFEGNTHVNLKGNIRPKMKEQQTSKAKEGYLSLIFSNNSLDLVFSIHLDQTTKDLLCSKSPCLNLILQ